MKMTQHILVSCLLDSGVGKIPSFSPSDKYTTVLSEIGAL